MDVAVVDPQQSLVYLMMVTDEGGRKGDGDVRCRSDTPRPTAVQDLAPRVPDWQHGDPMFMRDSLYSWPDRNRGHPLSGVHLHVVVRGMPFKFIRPMFDLMYMWPNWNRGHPLAGVRLHVDMNSRC